MELNCVVINDAASGILFFNFGSIQCGPDKKSIFKMIFQRRVVCKKTVIPSGQQAAMAPKENFISYMAFQKNCVRYRTFVCQRLLNVMVYQVLHIFLFAADYFRFTIFNGIISQIFQMIIFLLQMLFRLRCQNWHSDLF